MSMEQNKNETPNNVFAITSLLLSIMDLIVDVLLEVGSIALMGCICFIVYVYGKIFLIRIGLINPEQEDGKDS